MLARHSVRPMQRFTVDPESPDPAALAAAVAALTAGDLVAFPTETVYGLGVRADDPAALKALADAKGRPFDQPVALLVPDADSVSHIHLRRSILWKRLTDRYWPGPLTLVAPLDLELSGDGLGESASDKRTWCGVRVAGHPVARALLRSTRLMVRATSANRHGEPPALTADEVLERMDPNDIAVLLDGGPEQLAEASSVVAAGDAVVRVLREGVIDRAAIGETVGVERVCFVCTGNTCRSPMAAAHLIAGMQAEADAMPGAGSPYLRAYAAASCGTNAEPGARATTDAIEAMDGFDAAPLLADHRARALDRDHLARHDAIYTMTAAQRDRVREIAPEVAKRVELLDPLGTDIDDPLGQPDHVYRQTAKILGDAVSRRFFPNAAPTAGEHPLVT